jgi:hypothetical protein
MAFIFAATTATSRFGFFEITLNITLFDLVNLEQKLHLWGFGFFYSLSFKRGASVFAFAGIDEL